MIHSIGNGTSAFLGPSGFRDSGGVRSAKGIRAETSQVQASMERSGSLEVVTDDGDKVTISFSAISRLNASEASVQDGGASARSRDTASSVRLDVKVEGSLDQDEVSDMGKLLGRLGKVVRDAQRGDFDKVGDRLGKVQANDSLSSFRFAYQESRKVDYNSAWVVQG